MQTIYEHKKLYLLLSIATVAILLTAFIAIVPAYGLVSGSSPSGDLVVDGVNYTITGDHQGTNGYNSITVKNGGTLNIQPDDTVDGAVIDVTNKVLVIGNSKIIAKGYYTTSDPTNYNGKGVTINASDIEVDSTSSINANGQGYKGGTGPGVGSSADYGGGGEKKSIQAPLSYRSSSTDYGGGGGYGGHGGSNRYGDGSTYGSLSNPLDLGSGGGNSGRSKGASGGGAIKLVAAGTLKNNGDISANGEYGWLYAGSGSGGSILIDANNLVGNGRITATGGWPYRPGGGSLGGGNGGGGRIAINYTNKSWSGKITASGGVNSWNQILDINPAGTEKGTVFINPTIKLWPLTVTPLTNTTMRIQLPDINPDKGVATYAIYNKTLNKYIYSSNGELSSTPIYRTYDEWNKSLGAIVQEDLEPNKTYTYRYKYKQINNDESFDRWSDPVSKTTFANPSVYHAIGDFQSGTSLDLNIDDYLFTFLRPYLFKNDYLVELKPYVERYDSYRRQVVFKKFGSLTSPTIDVGAGKQATVTFLSWETLGPSITSQLDNSSTINFQVAANDDNATWNYIGPDGTASTYFTIADGSNAAAPIIGRYLRYRAYFTRGTNDKVSPSLYSVKLGYTLATEGISGDQGGDTGNSVIWTSLNDFKSNSGTVGKKTYRQSIDLDSSPGDVKIKSIDNNTGTGVDGDLIVDGTTAANSTDGIKHDEDNPLVLDGLKNYRNVTLQNGAVVTHSPEAGAGTAAEGMELRVKVVLIIDATSKIDVSGKGYDPSKHNLGINQNAGAGPGSGYNDFGGGGGGGAYGSAGGDGSFGRRYGAGGVPYGQPLTVEYMGSGGGNSITTSGVSAYGGAGGGRVKIVASSANIDGSIQANGLGGASGRDNGGGGSGGGILLMANDVEIAGILSAAGGGGGSQPNAGNPGLNGYGGAGGNSSVAIGGFGGVPGLAGNGGKGSYLITGYNGGSSAGGGGAGGRPPYGGGGGGAGRIAVLYNIYNGGEINNGAMGYSASSGNEIIGPYAYYGKLDAYITPAVIGGDNKEGKVGLRYDIGQGKKAFWKSLDFDAEPLAEGEKIEFQLRVGNTVNELNNGTYFGPDGTNNTWFNSDNKTIPDSVFASRYAEVKVRLSTNVYSTPVLHSVTLNYEKAVTVTKNLGSATGDCGRCHSEKFPKDSFDRNLERTPPKFSKCRGCHFQHAGNGAIYKTTFGSFKNAESFNLSNPFTLNQMHYGKLSGHGGATGIGGCGGACHYDKPPACTDCHETVEHKNHGGVVGQTKDYVSPMPSNIGSWAGTRTEYSKALPCTNASCHNLQAPAKIITTRPLCNNCHPLPGSTTSLKETVKDGHPDVTDKHVSAQLQETCINDGCHTSNHIDVEHPLHNDKNGQTLTCYTCHDYKGIPKKDRKLDLAKVEKAIADKDTNCSSCHGIASHYEKHEAEPKIDSGEYLDGALPCKDCHDNNLQDQHLKMKDLKGNNLKCDTCHNYENEIILGNVNGHLNPDDVKNAIAAKNTKCTNCHKNINHKNVHDKAKPNSQVCKSCHYPNVVSEHVEKRGFKCAVCHSSQDQKVIDTINKGKGENGQTVYCTECHGNKHPSPHMNYTQNTELCAFCHSTHTAPTANLLRKKVTYQSDFCLACHDGTGSQLGTKNNFKNASHHPLQYGDNPNGTLKCTDCHDPHGNKKENDSYYTRLLKSKDKDKNYSYEGNQFCYSCHGKEGKIKDMRYFENSAHNNADSGQTRQFPNPDSGTKIKCIICHNSHGADFIRLLVNSTKDLCKQCHDEMATANRVDNEVIVSRESAFSELMIYSQDTEGTPPVSLKGPKSVTVPTEKTNHSRSNQAVAIAVGDADNDGVTDVVRLESNVSNNPLTIFSGGTNGKGFSKIKRFATLPSGVLGSDIYFSGVDFLAVGDYLSDGMNEIVYSDGGANIYVYRIIGDSIVFNTTLKSGGTGTGELEIADVNNDGINEIVVVNNRRSSPQVYGSYGGYSPYNYNFSVLRQGISTKTFDSVGPLLATGDVNGDGKNDVVTAGFSYGSDKSNAEVHLQQADGLFNLAKTYTRSLPYMYSDIAIGNVVSATPRKEIIITSYGMNVDIYDYTQDQPLYTSDERYVFSEIAVGDVNGDGKVDLVGVGAEGIGVLSQKADGTGLNNLDFYPGKRIYAYNDLVIADVGNFYPYGHRDKILSNNVCTDCHDPHNVRKSDPVIGSQGVEPTYDGNKITYTQTIVTKEYQLCMKCHSTAANPQIGMHNTAKEFNPNGVSFHPVLAQGKQLNIPASWFVNGITVTSKITCTDCHGQGEGIAGQRRHESKLGNYLSKSYLGVSTRDEGLICFSCHKRDIYTAGNYPAYFGNHKYPSNIDFYWTKQGLHNEHTRYTLCLDCHNSHGSPKDKALLRKDLGFTEQNGYYFCAKACHGGPN